MRVRRSFMYVGGARQQPTALDLCNDGTVVFGGKANVGTWTVTSESRLVLSFDHKGRPDRMRVHTFQPIPNTDGWMYIDSRPKFNVTLVPFASQDAVPPPTPHPPPESDAKPMEL